MAKTQTTPWDKADHIQSEADVIAYLEAALEVGDPALVAATLGDIVRARVMMPSTRESGRERESR